PYGKGEFHMNIFLPQQGITMDTFLEEVTWENWQTWTNNFRKMSGTLWLPKFTLEYETTLNTVLEQLGMTSAFDKSVADFSAMIQQSGPVWIDEVKQKTFVEVNEEGTEA